MSKYRENKCQQKREEKLITAGKVESIPPGTAEPLNSKTVRKLLFKTSLAHFTRLKIYAGQGRSSCRSALVRGIVEGNLGGWRFDVGSGECMTKRSLIRIFRSGDRGRLEKDPGLTETALTSFLNFE